MRPVDRGDAPQVFTNYKQATPFLKLRIGRYCSYCERKISASLAVEHVIARNNDDTMNLEWDNFLLACVNCNSTKKDKPTNETDFLWPDKDNTLKAIKYEQGGLPKANQDLDSSIQDKAAELIDLVGLDRHPGHPKYSDADDRFLDREEVWELATRYLSETEQDPNYDKNVITDLAHGYGCFSVWLDVFSGDSIVRQSLINSFPGTAKNCFDAQWNTVSRPGGHT